MKEQCWSLFLKKRSETTTRTLQFLKCMKEQKTPVYFIRCDNLGENNNLKHTTNKAGMNVTYHFTAAGSPLRNSLKYMQSMLNQASLPTHLQQTLWTEAAHHATDVINGICTSCNKPTIYTILQERSTLFPPPTTFWRISNYCIITMF
jgi:hypothetical protein